MVFKQKQAEKPFYRRHGYLLSIRIEAQNSKILPSVYCVMNVVTPTDPEMRQIVDSGYMDKEPARFRDKGGEKR